MSGLFSGDPIQFCVRRKSPGVFSCPRTPDRRPRAPRGSAACSAAGTAGGRRRVPARQRSCAPLARRRWGRAAPASASKTSDRDAWVPSIRELARASCTRYGVMSRCGSGRTRPRRRAGRARSPPPRAVVRPSGPGPAPAATPQGRRPRTDGFRRWRPRGPTAEHESSLNPRRQLTTNGLVLLEVARRPATNVGGSGQAVGGADDGDELVDDVGQGEVLRGEDPGHARPRAAPRASSGGMMPPTTTGMSASPAARSPSQHRGHRLAGASRTARTARPGRRPPRPRPPRSAPGSAGCPGRPPRSRRRGPVRRSARRRWSARPGRACRPAAAAAAGPARPRSPGPARGPRPASSPTSEPGDGRAGTARSARGTRRRPRAARRPTRRW